MNSNNVLLSKYLNQYQKNPTSRVFAPLAEAYRKAGMVNDAIKVLKDGLKYNKDYELGYVILAHCYFDHEEYQKGYNVLRPYVKKSPDNIKLQRVFGDICYKLLKYDEALNSYKYILFINAQDDEIQNKVLELENNLYLKDKYQVEEKESKESKLENWSNLEVNQDDSIESENELEVDSWNMQKLTDEVVLEDQDSEDVANNFQEINSVEKLDVEDDDEPMLTHTMVDIYTAQQHYDKALELIEKILESNPNDEKLINKKRKINRVLYGHSIDNNELEKKLLDFRDAIKLRAELIIAKYSLT